MDSHTASKLTGRLIHVLLRGGEKYEGILKYADEKEKKLVMKNVKDLVSNKKLRNDKHFYGDQIQDLSFPEQANADDDKENESSKRCQNNNEEPKNKFAFLDPSDDGPSLFQMGHIEPAHYIKGNDYGMRDLSLTEPQKAVVINKIDASFYEAITFISNQRVVSLLINGPKKINRFGVVSLVTVGTRQMVYLFDIDSLGDDGIFKGLLSIIENPNILKVCHDVRMLSDCLQGKYNIYPVNIFDTQVADAFIHKNEYGKFPEIVSTLADCTKRHLGKTFEKHSSDLRNQQTQKNIAKKAMYLRELKPIMMEKLLADYLRGVDIYLDIVRKQPDQAVKFVNVNKLPREFFKEFSKSNDAFSGKFQNGRRQNAAHSFNRSKQHDDTEDDEIEPSSSAATADRSVWDNGENFSSQYQEKHGEIIESMGTCTLMIDENKPLLRKPKSPKPISPQPEVANTNNSQSHKTNSTEVPTNQTFKNMRERSNDSDRSNHRNNNDKESLSNSKSHIRDFRSRETQFNDYQFSGTSDSDDNCLVTNNNKVEEFDPDEIVEIMQMEMKRAGKNRAGADHAPTSKPPSISDAGKRMILHGIGQKTQKLSEPPTSYYSSSPASSVDTNEFPTLQESREASMKSSPGKSKHPSSSPFFQVKARGRGQILKHLTDNLTAPHVRRLSPALCDISPPRQIHEGVNSAYDFPSDEELLETPHVVPAVVGAPVIGQKVSVLKRFK